jgi:hypothetical protein
MFLSLKYEGIRSCKEEAWEHRFRENLGFLLPGHVLFFDPKIFVMLETFKFTKISGFLTICYFLKLLHIAVVIKMQINIPTTFYKTRSYSITLSLYEYK